MKKYRIAYDNIFIPNDPDNGLNYKGEDISDLTIYMIFKVIDKKTNQEVFFESENLVEQVLEYSPNKFCYVNNFYKCVIDEKELYRMIPNERLFNESHYIVLYEKGECYKLLGSSIDPTSINYDEFLDILKNNLSAFNNLDNKPTQSTAYYTVEVD